MDDLESLKSSRKLDEVSAGYILCLDLVSAYHHVIYQAAYLYLLMFYICSCLNYTRSRFITQMMYAL